MVSAQDKGTNPALWLHDHLEAGVAFIFNHNIDGQLPLVVVDYRMIWRDNQVVDLAHFTAELRLQIADDAGTILQVIALFHFEYLFGDAF
jgi:hypothetical protein